VMGGLHRPAVAAALEQEAGGRSRRARGRGTSATGRAAPGRPARGWLSPSRRSRRSPRRRRVRGRTGRTSSARSCRRGPPGIEAARARSRSRSGHGPRRPSPTGRRRNRRRRGTRGPRPSAVPSRTARRRDAPHPVRDGRRAGGAAWRDPSRAAGGWGSCRRGGRVVHRPRESRFSGLRARPVSCMDPSSSAKGGSRLGAERKVAVTAPRCRDGDPEKDPASRVSALDLVSVEPFHRVRRGLAPGVEAM
jgi:hypothetical protein